MCIESSGRLSAGVRVTTYHLRGAEFSTVSLRGAVAVLRLDLTDAERYELGMLLLDGLVPEVPVVAAGTASPSPAGETAAASAGGRWDEVEVGR